MAPCLRAYVWYLATISMVQGTMLACLGLGPQSQGVSSPDRHRGWAELCCILVGCELVPLLLLLSPPCSLLHLLPLLCCDVEFPEYDLVQWALTCSQHSRQLEPECCGRNTSMTVLGCKRPRDWLLPVVCMLFIQGGGHCSEILLILHRESSCDVAVPVCGA